MTRRFVMIPSRWISRRAIAALPTDVKTWLLEAVIDGDPCSLPGLYATVSSHHPRADGVDDDELASALQETGAALFWPEHEVLWVPSLFETAASGKQSPQQIKGWHRALADFPRPIQVAVAEHFAQSGYPTDTLSIGYPEGTDTPSVGYREGIGQMKTEIETKMKTEIETKTKTKAKTQTQISPAPPPDEPEPTTPPTTSPAGGPPAKPAEKRKASRSTGKKPRKPKRTPKSVADAIAIVSDATDPAQVRDPPVRRPYLHELIELDPDRVAGYQPQQLAWEIYRSLYVGLYGSEPTERREWFVQLARLLQQHGLDEIMRRLRVYFEAPPFALREGSRDMGRFVRHFDALAPDPLGDSAPSDVVTEAGDRYSAVVAALGRIATNGAAKRMEAKP